MVDERQEELETLNAIYPELIIHAEDPFSASLELDVTPTRPLLVRFIPGKPASGQRTSYAAATSNAAHIERDVEFSHLPPLSIRLHLPEQYPSDAPPTVQITTQYDWLPASKLIELEKEVVSLWEDYGRCQMLFAYIDFLQQSAGAGFSLEQSPDGCLVLPLSSEEVLVNFNTATRQAKFNAGTYDCEICLEPKKGSSCHAMRTCGHVFCKTCLLDFYNNAITEGDILSVKCLSPTCGKDSSKGASGAKCKPRPLLQPRELLAIGAEEKMVRRYVEMKRKKRIESDKSTVYCPRTWCQGPAKSTKYPPIPADLTTLVDPESSSEDEGDAKPPADQKEKRTVPSNPSDRLSVCEKCSLAFCNVCYMGWHGPLARCYPRDPSELSAEEKASYEYIRLNTTPCPYCNSPTQKTMGCNHMICATCQTPTHFCYLCSSWLDPQNPYQHFNKPGTPCYQRLWELEEGDEGQAPADGRGFAGERHWEQLAIEAARAAEAQEAAEAAQAEEFARAERQLQRAPVQARRDDIVDQMARAQLDGARIRPRRRASLNRPGDDAGQAAR